MDGWVFITFLPSLFCLSVVCFAEIENFKSATAPLRVIKKKDNKNKKMNNKILYFIYNINLVMIL